MLPSGRVRKLNMTSIKSLPTSTNATLFCSLSTRSLTRISNMAYWEEDLCCRPSYLDITMKTYA
ncbi:hypothetical protein MA16_Dca029080 [Dendrobium catenatum]|uniref:Uncharacterized protein n=1 Tax=Dendrobium catenatum TaxID=906689 RepID=A0A2I0V8R4_9ASPA|nr:hypothetical protein MA16_Dca029080 [Dendrobium catenatum]